MKYNVNFKYNRKKEIFKDFEIEIPENKITVIATIPLFSSLNVSYIFSNKIYSKLKIHPKIVANGPKKPPTLVNTNNSNLLFLLNYQKTSCFVLDFTFIKQKNG